MNPMEGPETVRPKEEKVREKEREREREREDPSEGHRVRMRKTVAVPSDRELEEHNVDHAMFHAWCPHCVKGRWEAY